MEIKISKLQFWGAMLALVTPLVLVLIWGVKLEARSQDVSDVKDAQLKTMTTLAVACRNIEMLGEGQKKLQDELLDVKRKQAVVYNKLKLAYTP